MEGGKPTKDDLQKELIEVQKVIRGWRKTKKFAKSIDHKELLVMAKRELKEHKEMETELADMLWVKLGVGSDNSD